MPLASVSFRVPAVAYAVTTRCWRFAAGVLTGLAFSIIVIFCLCVHLRFWRGHETYGAWSHKPCFSSGSAVPQAERKYSLGTLQPARGLGTMASSSLCNGNFSLRLCNRRLQIRLTGADGAAHSSRLCCARPRRCSCPSW